MGRLLVLFFAPCSAGDKVVVFHSTGAATRGAARFLLPVSECFDSFYTILEELQRDAWTVDPAVRPHRSTGSD